MILPLQFIPLQNHKQSEKRSCNVPVAIQENVLKRFKKTSLERYSKCITKTFLKRSNNIS